jgi:hypothetical protein
VLCATGRRYHNFERACEWLELQRQVMYDTTKADWFIRNDNGTIFSIPAGRPNVLGDTYFWNYSNPQAAAYVIESTMADLSDPLIDGSYLECAAASLATNYRSFILHTAGRSSLACSFRAEHDFYFRDLPTCVQ